MARSITDEEKALAQRLLERGRAAMRQAYDYNEERVDDLARAVGWAIANETPCARRASALSKKYRKRAS